jgi:hypothetical protein
MTEYIEIDSTFRNRKMFPNPSNFEILFSQSLITKKSAYDPVSLSMPVLTFDNSLNQTLPATGVITGLSESSKLQPFAVGSAGDQETIIANMTGVKQLDNYYNGLILAKDDGSNKEFRRIKKYHYLGNNKAEITVDSKFSSPIEDETLYITSPTDFENSVVFIPSSSDNDNEYLDMFLYNETNTESAKIISYHSETHIVEVDKDISSWTNDDILSIRKSLPLKTTDVDGANFTKSSFEDSTLSDYNVGDFIRITERNTISSTGVDSAYAPFYETSRIIRYENPTGYISPQLSVVPSTGSYEILPYSYDNFKTISYNGATVSQQQLSCYEIQLNTLILPNELIKSHFGGRILNHPNVYVELYNISSPSSGARGHIYSNNPNSNRALFIASINDKTKCCDSPFIKINGDCMKQQVKFKPNDSLGFSVKFSDGKFFETIKTDNFSPSEPNWRLQIKALFSIKKLNK